MPARRPGPSSPTGARKTVETPARPGRRALARARPACPRGAGRRTPLPPCDRAGARRAPTRRRGRGRRPAGRAPSPRPRPGRGRPRAPGRGSARALAQPCLVGRHVAARRRARAAIRSVRRSPPPPTITGTVADRARVEVVSGSETRSSGVRPWCRAPRAPASSRSPRSSASSRSRGGGNGRPKAACSRSHQPAPTPTNARPPVERDSVAAALAVMPGRRGRSPACTSVPSRSRGVEAGEQRRASPTARGSAPRRGRPAGSGSGGPSARCPAKPGLVRGQRRCRAATPAGPRPREAGDLEHHLRARSDAVRLAGSGAAVRRGRVRPARVAVGRRPGTTRSQPSPSSWSATPRRRASWLGQHPRRAPAGRARRCGAGTRRRGCRRRRRPPAARAARAARASRGAGRRPAPRVSTTVVSPRRSRPATTRSSRANASAEASRSCAPAADDPAQVVGGDDLGGAVALRAPRSTCPSPRRRPARRAPGRAAARRRVSASVSASGGGRGRRARPRPCARGAPR